ncbi:PaaI family thioesterase [Paenibacillus sp. RC84]|uniref:PaaI family thioesterase n=1 Tax=Paenibacillus sp. RC84 TaxID=3156252 RepID=UPI003512F2EB
MQASEQHANPQGTCNGGIIGILADMAMEIAYGSTLQEDETFTAIEMKVNFFRPVWNAKIRPMLRCISGDKQLDSSNAILLTRTGNSSLMPQALV